MADKKKTGVGYYVEQLVGSLADNHSNSLKLTGYYFDLLNRNGSIPNAPHTVRFRKIKLMPGKLISVCRRLGFQPPLELFTRTHGDITLFTNFVSLPMLRRSKVVLIVYDLGFLDEPQYTQKINLAFLQRFCPPSIRQADTIITISEFTESRLRHYFPDLKANIIVTPIPPPPIKADRAGSGHGTRTSLALPENFKRAKLQAGKFLRRGRPDRRRRPRKEPSHAK